LCGEIVRKHHRALYVVMENVATAQDTMQKLMRSLIEETPRLAYGYREKGLEDYVVFDHEEWDVPTLRVGEHYHGSNRLLYFVVYSKFMESLEIWLELGPGDAAASNKLLSMSQKNPSVFDQVPESLGEETQQLLKYPLLAPELLHTLSDEQREREIRKGWDEFLNKILPPIIAALRKEKWIWEPVSTDPV
jgi:hypothetical protein